MAQPQSPRIGFILLVSSLLLIAGCNKNDPNAQDNPRAGPPSGFAGMPEPTGPHAAGKKVFNASCARCHSDGQRGGMMGGPPMGGMKGGGPPFGGMRGGPPKDGAKEGGPPMADKGGPPIGDKGGPPMGGMKGFGRGPDLTKVAADAEHTRDWLKQHILDPQSQKEDSRMPKFAGKLDDEQLNALLDYLMTLK